jgi:hypothetical protein
VWYLLRRVNQQTEQNYNFNTERAGIKRLFHNEKAVQWQVIGRFVWGNVKKQLEMHEIDRKIIKTDKKFQLKIVLPVLIRLLPLGENLRGKVDQQYRLSLWDIEGDYRVDWEEVLW